MKSGQEAIDLLIKHHPKAHEAFGDFKSIDHFAVVVSDPKWHVFEEDKCWILAQRGTFSGKAWEVHWFCPEGANLKKMRKLLTAVFEATDAIVVFGSVPEGHPKERAARAVNRALGARKIHDVYVLTRTQHSDYNRRDSKSGA